MANLTIEELREKVRQAEERKRVALAAECTHAGDTLASAEEYWAALRDRDLWRRRLAAAEKREAEAAMQPTGRLAVVNVYRNETQDEITRTMMSVFNELHPGDEVDMVDGEIVRRDEVAEGAD